MLRSAHKSGALTDNNQTKILKIANGATNRAYMKASLCRQCLSHWVAVFSIIVGKSTEHNQTA